MVCADWGPWKGFGDGGIDGGHEVQSSKVCSASKFIFPGVYLRGPREKELVGEILQLS